MKLAFREAALDEIDGTSNCRGRYYSLGGGSFPSVHRIIAKNDNELDKLSARLSIDRSAAVRANRFIIGGRVKREKRVHAFLGAKG